MSTTTLVFQFDAGSMTLQSMGPSLNTAPCMLSIPNHLFSRTKPECICRPTFQRQTSNQMASTHAQFNGQGAKHLQTPIVAYTSLATPVYSSPTNVRAGNGSYYPVVSPNAEVKPGTFSRPPGIYGYPPSQTPPQGYPNANSGVSGNSSSTNSSST